MSPRPQRIGIGGPQRPIRNEAERLFARTARRRGFIVTRRGWPDFFCARDVRAKGDIMLVEVKPHRGRRLKREQLTVMAALARYGVPCFRWSPDGGLEPVTPQDS